MKYGKKLTFCPLCCKMVKQLKKGITENGLKLHLIHSISIGN